MSRLLPWSWLPSSFVKRPAPNYGNWRPEAFATRLVLLPVGPFEIVPGDSSAAFTVPDNRGGFSGKTSQLTGRITVAPSADGDAYTARELEAMCRDAGFARARCEDLPPTEQRIVIAEA